MTCNLNCFSCQYLDCIREETQDENERAARWIRENPEKRRVIRRKYYITHQEQEKAYQKERYKTIKDTPEYKTKKREYQREFRARMKAEKANAKSSTTT